MVKVQHFSLFHVLSFFFLSLSFPLSLSLFHFLSRSLFHSPSFFLTLLSHSPHLNMTGLSSLFPYSVLKIAEEGRFTVVSLLPTALFGHIIT